MISGHGPPCQPSSHQDLWRSTKQMISILMFGTGSYLRDYHLNICSFQVWATNITLEVYSSHSHGLITSISSIFLIFENFLKRCYWTKEKQHFSLKYFLKYFHINFWKHFEEGSLHTRETTFFTEIFLKVLHINFWKHFEEGLLNKRETTFLYP